MLRGLGATAGLASCGALVACADVGPTPRAPAGVTAAHRAIVNGDLEDGWPAVGALTLDHPDFGYTGSVCTATLITPRWVLTAAHCVETEEVGRLEPEWLSFYVGEDAEPTPRGERPRGAFAPVEAVFVHPDYSPVTYAAPDVALLRLAQPVRGVEALPLNDSRLEGREGGRVFYVGFGVDDGVEMSGGGRKRSTDLVLQHVRPAHYFSGAADRGVCFGDSGGPGLMQIGGVWKVVGVNSALAVMGEREPCIGSAIHVRVDAELSWIRRTMGERLSCADGTLPCACRPACTPAGYCDHRACGPRIACGAGVRCLLACGEDQLCQVNCLADLQEGAAEALVSLFDCASFECPEVRDPLDDRCTRDRCRFELDECVGDEPPEPPPPEPPPPEPPPPEPPPPEPPPPEPPPPEPPPPEPPPPEPPPPSPPEPPPGPGPVPPGPPPAPPALQGCNDKSPPPECDSEQERSLPDPATGCQATPLQGGSVAWLLGVCGFAARARGAGRRRASRMR